MSSSIQTKKSPNSLQAISGFSENIHSSPMNSPYLNMIFENPKCLDFCCDVLQRYECLLQRFSSDNPIVYQGNEVDAFVALYNTEKSLKASIKAGG